MTTTMHRSPRGQEIAHRLTADKPALLASYVWILTGPREFGSKKTRFSVEKTLTRTGHAVQLGC